MRLRVRLCNGWGYGADASGGLGYLPSGILSLVRHALKLVPGACLEGWQDKHSNPMFPQVGLQGIPLYPLGLLEVDG